jgi:hypothetical protein
VRSTRSSASIATKPDAEIKAPETSQARGLASQQRDLAKERLYESLVREARFIRKMRQVGYRREVFARLKQAIALGTTQVDNSSLGREAAHRIERRHSGR